MYFARARFAIDAGLLAVAGCSFPPLNDSLEGSFTTWREAYAVACLCVAVTLEVFAFVGKFTSHPALSSLFNNTLFFVIRIVNLVKVVALRFLLRAEARRVTELITQAEAYEESRNIRVRYKAPLFKTAYRCVSFVSVMTFFAARWHVYVKRLFSNSPLPLKAFLDFLTVLSASCMTVWDGIHTILVRYFADVFLEYLKAENVALTALTQRKVIGFGRAMSTALRGIESNYEEILRMVATARSVLRSLVFFGFACNAVIVCAVLYSYTDGTSTISLLLSGTLYAAYTIAETLDITFAAETLATEVRICMSTTAAVS